MKTKITRNQMFETNSSATHSLVINIPKSKIKKVSRAGNLIINMVKDHMYMDIRTSKEKIQWLVTYLFVSAATGETAKDINVEDMDDNRLKWDLMRIKETVEQNEGPIKEFRIKGAEFAYINHQIAGEWADLEDYLSSHSVALDTLLYSEDVVIKIGHD